MKDNSVYSNGSQINGSTDHSVPSSVIEKAKQGNQEAFRRISVLYSGLVYHWCRSSGLSPQDAEDVGQQVFLTVSKSLGSFSRVKPGDSFRAWLRVITRTRIVDHFRESAHYERAIGGDRRSNKEVAVVFDLPEDETYEDQICGTALLYEKAVCFVQGEFSDIDCRAFHLVVVDGVSPKEAASQLGVSVNSIYIAKSRILKRLREEFVELLDDDWL